MGMGSPQKPYGVRDFKTKFGGEVINFGRWQLINNKFRYQLGLFGYYILKKFSSS
jgi:serine/alanine adding enzyme